MEKIVSINQEDLIITITNEIPGKERGIVFLFWLIITGKD